jgi:small subunit ribosomal protein S6
VLEVTTNATNLDSVDRMLRLADEIVRHKILRLPDGEATRRGLRGEAATPAPAG